MTREEAERIIREYVPQKPTAYYYNDPYDDGKYCGSGWRYEYPPVSGALIDAILERDKNCKPYDYEKDSTEIRDEKFCDELAERFTSLMKRANESGNTAVDEYRKNNSCLYSMVTENHNNKITVIPISLSTLVDFKEKCKKAADEIGLKKYYVYEHKDRQDVSGKMVYESGLLIDDSAEIVFSDALRYCDYFKRHEKESSNYEVVENLCDSIKEQIKCLYNTIEANYLQRINNYIAKE